VVCSMSQLAVVLQDIITMRTEEIEGLKANQGGSVAQHCLGIWSGKACGAWEIVRQDPPGGGGGGGYEKSSSKSKRGDRAGAWSFLLAMSIQR
jgi:hypothetical protein